MNGSVLPTKCGEFYRLERDWEGEVLFTLCFPMIPQLVSRPNNLYALVRGPLVYSLRIGERWVRINEDMVGHEPPHCDYEVYPTTPWNYGLCINKDVSELEFIQHPLGDCPFSPDGAPITVKVNGKKVEWSMEKGAVVPYPEMGWIAEVTEELTLIPYGCTNLRITEMPLI
jgi:hypothetical protein